MADRIILKCIHVFTCLLAHFLGQAQETNGLVAKFSFNNGNVRNEVGSNRAKEYGTKLAEDRFGNKNMARYFLGNIDSYINLGSGTELKPKRGTVSLWVKVDQAVYKGEGFHCNPIIHVRSHAEDDFNEGYSILYHFNVRKLHCNTSTSELNQVTIYPAETSFLRQWYHLAMTYDDKMLKFYVNGLLDTQSAKNFESHFLEGDSVLLGIKYGQKNKRYFQGVIDDVLIYNRVISAKEILALYNDPDPNKSSLILKWAFICLAGIIFITLVILLVKWRIAKAVKKEEEKNMLRNNWFEQENKVLTAQMDPHFIFNSLNTIQQFIIINDNEKAQLYLSKFSRLLRMILENNVKDAITLKEEMEIIQKYLEIESLRFSNVFKYEISVDKNIDPSNTNIPRFLIQPFVENAIWHGLLPKNGDKQLQITFQYENDKVLTCMIEDNGVGRKNKLTSEGRTGRSFAIKFIEQRLQLMTKLHNKKYDLVIIDKTSSAGENNGTKIIITIPILNN